MIHKSSESLNKVQGEEKKSEANLDMDELYDIEPGTLTINQGSNLSPQDVELHGLQHQNSRMDQKGSVSQNTQDNKSATRGRQNGKAQNTAKDQSISIDGFDSSDSYQLPPLPGQLDRPRKPKKNQEMGQADDFVNVKLSCESTQIPVSKSEQAHSNIDTKGQNDTNQVKSKSDLSKKGQAKSTGKKETSS